MSPAFRRLLRCLKSHHAWPLSGLTNMNSPRSIHPRKPEAMISPFAAADGH
jgi:hypothetical protein